jgi:hypothetical protein
MSVTWADSGRVSGQSRGCRVVVVAAATTVVVVVVEVVKQMRVGKTTTQTFRDAREEGIGQHATLLFVPKTAFCL